MLPHELAVLFHSTYECLAPAFGWRTKKGCNVPFEQLPQRNQALMLATCQTVLNALQEQLSPALPAHNSTKAEALASDQDAETKRDAQDVKGEQAAGNNAEPAPESDDFPPPDETVEQPQAV